MPVAVPASDAKLIDGKAIAADVMAQIAHHVSVMQDTHGVSPSLAVVQVGNDPASTIYVNNKEQAAKRAGIKTVIHRLPQSTSQDEVLKLVAKLNQDKGIDGILVQLPLPRQIDAATVIRALDPRKDVDGLHPENVGRLATGMTAMVPCTPLGCLLLLRRMGVEITGRQAMVIGCSNLVGRPMAQLLLREGATVTSVHSKSRNPEILCRMADIVVAAAGHPKLVKADWIKPGATVIDVGITRMDDGSLSGDVDFDAVKNVAGAITPVPGGVGPMTIACLFYNTLIAACRRAELTEPLLH